MSGFHTTRWSLVASARDGASESARTALGKLCEIYWYPLYAFLRRRKMTDEDARDHVQGFFADLLEKHDIAAEPERGRFRSYILGALRNHVANAARRDRAEKRGGGQPLFSLDAAEADRRYAEEPADGRSPEQLFERRWALTVLERAMARLETEYADRGRAHVLAKLKDCLTGQSAETLASHAASLDMTESAVKVVVHRLRVRMRELIRDEIAQTVTAADDVDDEQRRLFEALAG